MAQALLRGIIPALYTAYDDEGNVSRKRMARLVRASLESGVHGFFVCGTTGDGLLLNVAERKAVAEVVVGETAGQVPVMVHVGAMCTRDSIELARHAAAIGADAVSSIPPTYYRYAWEEVVSYFRELCGATDLPFYLYYIPQLTGSRITPERLVADLVSIPGMAGMKFSAPEIADMYRIGLLAGEGFNLLSGPDELMVQAAMLGANGAVGTSYNHMPGPFLKAYEALRTNDYETAKALQLQANQGIELYHRFGGIRVGRAILRLQGLDCGGMRAPLSSFPETQMDELRRDLEAMDFFSWAR